MLPAFARRDLPDHLAFDVPALRDQIPMYPSKDRRSGLALWAICTLLVELVLILADGGSAQAQRRTRTDRRHRRPIPAAVPVQPSAPPTAAANLPLAVVRQECSGDDKVTRLCETVQEAANAVAGQKYQIIDAAKVEALFTREPSLRGCRRDECREAIAEQLGAFRVIDIIIQSVSHRGLIADVSIFDPGAKGIAADTEVQLKRDESKLRRSIEEAVDLVITTQRLTAPLRLDIKPPSARVKLIDGRGGTRELTDSERDGTREVRVFLGPYTVRVEKPGFLAQDQTVTVAQTGASVSVQLKTQPVPVKFEWTPEGTRVLVDGEVVDARDKVIEISEGKHKVEAIAPRGSPYESSVSSIEVRVGMEPVRIALQRLTELRISLPAGYVASVDDQVIAAERLQIRGHTAETSVPTTPGPHTITATSWHGYQIVQKVEAHARSSTDMVIKPPSLVPGAVLGGVGLLATLAGTAVFIAGYTRDICTRPDCLTFFKPDLPGGLLVGIGGATLIAGISWFGWSASNHPLFHRMPRSTRASAPRISLLPSVSKNFAGVLSELRF